MRRTTVVIAGALLLGAVTGIWWTAGGPARQGTSAAAVDDCVPDVGAVRFPSPAREGLDRFVVPVGPVPVAPLRAVVCRYGAGGLLVAGLRLDPARTATLAGAVAAPLVPLPGGWPSDALAAKRIPPLSPADLATVAAPPCPSVSGERSAPADVVTFTYTQGPQVAVRVRTGPCRDVSNGTLTVRTPDRVLTALAALPLPAVEG